MLAGQAPPPIFCDFNDMSDVLSQHALDLRTDDNPPSIWRNSIYRAGSKMTQYLVRRYDTASLAGNYWVCFNTAIVACYILCGGRGNTRPTSLVSDYKDTIESLKEVRSGLADIPDLAARRQSCPVMSNIRILLAPQPHARVHRSMSTTTGGEVSAYQQIRDLSEATDIWLNFPLT